jgi:hypothetical protein
VSLPTQKGYDCAADFAYAGVAMPAHKFKIGQTVFLPSFSNMPKGEYVITKRLPRRDDEFEYEIKNLTARHECIISERQLRNTSQQTRARGHKRR